MISVNLLPQEFQLEKKTTSNVPVRKIAIGIGGLFAVLTLIFYVDFWLSFSRLKKIESEWNKVAPEALILKQLQSEVEGPLKQERDFMAQFVTTDRPLTSILMWLSQFLPETAWLIEIKLEREGDASHLLVKGASLPSKEKSSIEQIETYLHQLKEKMPDGKLSLTTTRQMAGQVELTQFTALFDFGVQKK